MLDSINADLHQLTVYRFLSKWEVTLLLLRRRESLDLLDTSRAELIALNEQVVISFVGTLRSAKVHISIPQLQVHMHSILQHLDVFALNPSVLILVSVNTNLLRWLNHVFFRLDGV